MPVMCQIEREQKIERVDFLAQELKRRVWRNFDDVAERVQAHVDESYAALQAASGSEYFDEAETAEFALDEGTRLSEFLFDAWRNMSLASVAILYHQWEKDLRQFLSRECSLYAKESDVDWTGPIWRILRWLEKRDWPLQQYSWFPTLDAFRLVVNVHKHGNGPALIELNRKYPEYLGLPERNISGDEEHDFPHFAHESLSVTEENFDQFVEAIRQFWRDLPSEVSLEES